MMWAAASSATDSPLVPSPAGGQPQGRPTLVRSTQGGPADELPSEVAALLAPADEAARERAWQVFLERYSLLLLHTAFTLDRDYDRAMDRYLYILDRLRRHDCHRLRKFQAIGRGKFSTWLVVVARRLCLDQHRQAYGRSAASRRGAPARDDARARRRQLADLIGAPTDLADLPDTGRADPATEVTLAESREALQAALHTLAPADRMLLALRFEQDLSAREIADAMGFPTPFQVYRRLNVLLATLRGRLRHAGIEGSAA